MQESFGEYKVLERLGAGRKAEVFRARDTRAGRTAAIKVLTSELAMDPVVGPPFVDDAYLAVKLTHPNAAALYEVGEQGGRPYLVFEFIQGQTLKALLAGQPINPRRALEFATQVADALADAHASGLVHRALRPEKILISQKGTAKVTDFGLGRYATAVAVQQSAGGAAVPAMAYWPPEQRAGGGDHRVDIYALGLLLLEMLTGRPPDGAGRPPELSDLGPGIQDAIAPALSRMIASEPERRVEAAATVAAELRAVSARLEAQRDAPPTPPPTAPPRGKSRKDARKTPPPRPPIAAKPDPVAPIKSEPVRAASAPTRHTGTPANGASSSARATQGRPAPPSSSGSTIWLIGAAVVAVLLVLWLALRG